MLDSLKSLRRGALVAAAAVTLAMGIPAMADAKGGHHHHHHGHHHHGHHHHGHHHHHHGYWRYRYNYSGYNQCSYWRNECGSRWGYGNYAYGRCMHRHGC